MSAIAGWILLGLTVGLMAHRISLPPFPGGSAGEAIAGAAGGFLGGGLMTLTAHPEHLRLDTGSLVAAAVTAVLLNRAIRRAQLAEPRVR